MIKFTTLLFLLSNFLGFATKPELVKKRIQNVDFNYEFSTLVNKDVTYNTHKFYYWYKAQSIHQTQGNSNSELLHSDYTKFNKDNSLAEKGKFKNGLKNGIWIEWYLNGNYKKITRWRNGFKQGLTTTFFDNGSKNTITHYRNNILDGIYKEYNTKGNLLISGDYNKNLKTGFWTSTINGQKLFYKKGEITDPPKNILKELLKKIKAKKLARKQKKEGSTNQKYNVKKKWYHQLFKKKNTSDNIDHSDKKHNNQRYNRSSSDKKLNFFEKIFKKKDKKQKKSSKNKPSFFKRIFKKKDAKS